MLVLNLVLSIYVNKSYKLYLKSSGGRGGESTGGTFGKMSLWYHPIALKEISDLPTEIPKYKLGLSLVCIDWASVYVCVCERVQEDSFLGSITLKASLTYRSRVSESNS